MEPWLTSPWFARQPQRGRCGSSSKRIVAGYHSEVKCPCLEAVRAGNFRRSAFRGESDSSMAELASGADFVVCTANQTKATATFQLS
jgi:hypothetical protein